MRPWPLGRLVVWISTAILGFQGATLAFDLLNCTALSWLYVRLNGFGPPPAAPALQQQAPQSPRAPGVPAGATAQPVQPVQPAQPMQPLALGRSANGLFAVGLPEQVAADLFGGVFGGRFLNPGTARVFSNVQLAFNRLLLSSHLSRPSSSSDPGLSGSSLRSPGTP